MWRSIIKLCETFSLTFNLSVAAYMNDKKPEIKKHQDSDESLVLWVLTSLFIVLTTLTINSYSELDEPNSGEQFLASPATQQNASSDLTLINSNSNSQIDSKTLKM